MVSRITEKILILRICFLLMHLELSELTINVRVFSQFFWHDNNVCNTKSCVVLKSFWIHSMRKKDVHSRQSLIANSLENWFTTFDMRLVVNIKKHNYHGFKNRRNCSIARYWNIVYKTVYRIFRLSFFAN